MMRHKRYMRPKVGNAWAYVAYIAYVAPRLYSRNETDRRPFSPDLETSQCEISERCEIR